MAEIKVSRRAALLGAGAVSAWLASPVRALVQVAGAGSVPAFVDGLIGRMTLEEKAGQLSLMASAWGPTAAAMLNPPNNSNFPQQLEETRRGQLTGIFNGNGARMARIMQTAAVKDSRMKIPLIFAADAGGRGGGDHPPREPVAVRADEPLVQVRLDGRPAGYKVQVFGTDMTVLKVMFGAIVTAMVLVFLTSGLGLLDFNLVYVNETYLWPGIVGGLIMGVGFIVGGFCPGTSLVAMATWCGHTMVRPTR